MKKLMNYAIYSNEKLSIDSLDVFYVGVENILPNKKGIKPSSFVPKTGKYTKFEKYDILLGNIGPYLKKIWLADKSGLASPDVLVIKPLESRFAKYIYANLLNDSFFQYAMLGVKGSILPRCDKNHIMNYSIPDVKNKEKIGDFIYFINKKIELNNKINDNLANMAQDIYMHWFFKKSPNGKLKDILLEATKSNVQVGDAKNCIGQYPFFTSGASILTWNKYFVNGRYCFLNTGGNADVKFYVGKSSYSTDTWCIYTKNDMNDYLYLLLLTIKEELNKKYFQGTGLKHLQKYLLINKDIYIPTESELFNFNNIVKPIFDNISSNKRETEKLTTLRDYLLPLLLNGQVTIED
ncbi:restriction endonuclease subunit S [Mesomycoplasma ovipneumoniae]